MSQNLPILGLTTVDVFIHKKWQSPAVLAALLLPQLRLSSQALPAIFTNRLDLLDGGGHIFSIPSSPKINVLAFAHKVGIGPVRRTYTYLAHLEDLGLVTRGIGRAS